MRAPLALIVAVALAACSSRPAPTASTAPAAATPPPSEARRPYAPVRDGAPVIEGVAYGPFRAGQRPGGPLPSDAEILEDLRILEPRWGMIRVYSSAPPTERILTILRDEALPIQVVVGAWISADDPAANAREVADAIRLANAFPEQVAAVSVGNETQVYWSGHRSPPGPLIDHLRAVRGAVAQPVTTADDYNFWNKPEAAPVAAEVDFVLLHAYAMWNRQSLDDAVPWTATTVASIRAMYPDHPVVLGETGWATVLNPEGGEVEHIKAPAGEAEQARFHQELRAWALAERQPVFHFEAFDEPWKGGDDPRDVEKHWGLFNEDRTPKAAMAGGTP
jgi:exo-beta-1,3-glucanase (GH17 family)